MIGATSAGQLADRLGEVHGAGQAHALQAPKVLGRSSRFVEALAFSARLLGELPLPPSFGLHVQGVPGVVRVALEPSAAERARAEGEVVLDRGEWHAVVLGAEADRLWPVDFAALCRRKRSEPAFRIEPETTLAGAQPDPAEEWSVAGVLERVGADVLAIDVP